MIGAVGYQEMMKTMAEKIRLLLLGTLLLVALPVGQERAGAQQVGGDTMAPSQGIFTRDQADLVLTLDQAVDLSLERSFTVYNLGQQYLQTNYLVENARRQLRTRINFDSTLPGITQMITPDLISDGMGGQELIFLRDSQSWVYSEINIVQPLITNGWLQLSTGLVGFDVFRELPNMNVESRSVQPSVGVQFNQPLFQYNQVRGTLRSASLSFESLDLRYTEDELRTINDVSQQYYNLYAQQEAVRLADERYRQSERNYQSGQRRLEAGLLAETDVMQLSVTRMNDLDALETAMNQLEQAQFAFNRMVGLPLDQQVWAEARQEYEPIAVDLERALELAFQNRSDLRRSEISREQLDLTLRQTRSDGRPDLQLNIGYDLTGNSSLTALPTQSWYTHLQESLDPENRSPNTNISMTLSIPLFDWGRNRSMVERIRSQIQVAERQIEETEQELIRTVTDRVRAVETAMRRLQIQEENVQVAQTSFDFAVRRFDRGEMTTTELARAQDQLSQTLNNRLNAWISFEMAKADLKEITLWDWETNTSAQRRTAPPEPFGWRRNGG